MCQGLSCGTGTWKSILQEQTSVQLTYLLINFLSFQYSRVENERAMLFVPDVAVLNEGMTSLRCKFDGSMASCLAVFPGGSVRRFPGPEVMFGQRAP